MEIKDTSTFTTKKEYIYYLFDLINLANADHKYYLSCIRSLNKFIGIFPLTDLQNGLDDVKDLNEVIKNEQKAEDYICSISELISEEKMLYENNYQNIVNIFYEIIQIIERGNDCSRTNGVIDDLTSRYIKTISIARQNIAILYKGLIEYQKPELIGYDNKCLYFQYFEQCIDELYYIDNPLDDIYDYLIQEKILTKKKIKFLKKRMEIIKDDELKSTKIESYINNGLVKDLFIVIPKIIDEKTFKNCLELLAGASLYCDYFKKPVNEDEIDNKIAKIMMNVEEELKIK